MHIVKYRKIFYIISALLILGSITAIGVWGLNPGIDFKGGAALEVEYTKNVPTQDMISASLAPLSLDTSVRPIGDNGYLIKTKSITDAERQSVEDVLSKEDGFSVKQFSSIGPILGAEAVRKSFVSILLVLICIVLFVTFAFRHVSEPVASWKYGLITVFALSHDVLVPAGVFAFLGHFQGVEIDTLFVTALLVVLGFSVHDTIVVFDRVRENLKISNEAKDKKEFETIVGESINQTFVRSINTSLTTLLALVVLFIFGGEATRMFSLALLVGITAGTYSSVFLGSPLLVTVQKWQEKSSK
jgi:preprotein translocase subunit SecF